MTVKYNQNGELTMDGISLKTIAQSFGTPTIVYDELQIREQMRRYHRAFKDSGLKYNIFHTPLKHLLVFKWSNWWLRKIYS